MVGMLIYFTLHHIVLNPLDRSQGIFYIVFYLYSYLDTLNTNNLLSIKYYTRIFSSVMNGKSLNSTVSWIYSDRPYFTRKGNISIFVLKHKSALH